MSKLTKQKIELLEMALRRMRLAPENSGICIVLGGVVVSNPHLEDAGAALTSYIRRALDGFSYLGGWLRYEHGVNAYSGRKEDNARARYKATRIAWVEWMIEQYKEQLKESK